MKTLRPSKDNIIKLFTHISEKALVAVLIVCGLGFNNPGFELDRFLMFLAAGVLSGLYNGLYNDYLWRNDDQTKKTKLLEYPIPYLIHTVFNHIVGGIVGAVSLYYLVRDINILAPQQVTFGVKDLVLFLIALTGYFGLLPRTLWYGSYGPTLGGKA
jgi:hypothetical protein